MIWQPLTTSDIPSVQAIAAQVHPDLFERPEIFQEKLELFPQGCKKLLCNNQFAGYGFAHPWRLYSIPQLDTFIDRIPAEPDCIYIHDVAILPHARGRNAAGLLDEQYQALAAQYGFGAISLVSVYMTTGFWKRFGFDVVGGEIIEQQLSSYGNDASYMTMYSDKNANNYCALIK
ncbi:MAG TPA: GNAT family N-acetyltransferase [Chitinispirillaceae bacterium]|nr:GNAT family N-acetyltransferase [Chitinispirillaceae bacterium]